MKASELRVIRHMALGIAEQCAALLEIVDAAMPTDAPATQEEAPDAVIEASNGLPPMLGPRGRTQGNAAEAAAAGTPATGTDAGNAAD
jgi:hypothetical protein